MGRPPYSRDIFRNYLLRQPGSRRGLVLVNQSGLARLIGCHRATVARMLDDLEAAGHLRRRRSKGPRGLLVDIRPKE